MPTYTYRPTDPNTCCDYCRNRFDHVARLADPPLAACPRCGNPVTKCIIAPTVGRGQSGFDDRAKAAGFHKLKRRDKGAYEKLY